MLNRIAVSGGSYDDWLEAVYTHERVKSIESPVYCGSLIKELAFEEVVSNARTESTEDGKQPLGTLAGRGRLTGKHKGGKIEITVNEPSYIMGIVSITPRVDYSQGNDWEMNLQSIYDLHKPHLDGIGFEESINEQRAWWTTNWDNLNSRWVQTSAGKRPAWSNYQTAVNKTFGNFAIPNNEMFMTNNRNYEFGYAVPSGLAAIKDLTTYVDPSKSNYIFADTRLDAMNFWVQVDIDCKSRRKMSAKVTRNHIVTGKQIGRAHV